MPTAISQTQDENKTGKLSAFAADVHKMMLLHSKCVDRKKCSNQRKRGNKVDKKKE
jgi:hypothetical protein